MSRLNEASTICGETPTGRQQMLALHKPQPVQVDRLDLLLAADLELRRAREDYYRVRPTPSTIAELRLTRFRLEAARLKVSESIDKE